MKLFADLYSQLDGTTKTARKVAALVRYFRECDPASGAWGVWFLSGRRLKRLVPVRFLQECCCRIAQLDDWLFTECYGSVGDLAETMALLLPDGPRGSTGTLAEWVTTRIEPLARQTPAEREATISAAWADLDSRERFVFNKLVTGGLRVGVSQGLVMRALAEVAGVPTNIIAQRLMGTWEPTPGFFERLLSADTVDDDPGRPYPFCLAHALAEPVETLGPISDWVIESKWDGIRAQLIRRDGPPVLWSRGEEPMLERFPELRATAHALPVGTVLDGEVLGWNEAGVMPFAALQKRINRKTVGKKLLAEVPVRYVVFDLLEWQGVDLRSRPLRERRRLLEELFLPTSDWPGLRLADQLSPPSWSECAAAQADCRSRGVEGLMLKRAAGEYGVGRPTGLWWKWKVQPMTCDAVLIYAQKGHGRRASLFTDYTFAVWNEGHLVPFAKAYSGLSDAEIREVDRFIREHTRETFGPVRSVTPELVFELAFEGIQPSPRHKSGVAVRFPRMLRWRRDKRADQADSLQSLRQLLAGASR